MGGEIPTVHDRNEDFPQFAYRIGSLSLLREVPCIYSDSYSAFSFRAAEKGEDFTRHILVLLYLHFIALIHNLLKMINLPRQIISLSVLFLKSKKAGILQGGEEYHQ